MLQYIGVFLVGITVGFLGGLFGKGGSAIATPILSLMGIPGYIAVAAPLPATIPGTFIASLEYWKSKLIDWQIVIWSIAIGIPSTIVGSYLSAYTGAAPLLILTGILVLVFGVSFLFAPKEGKHRSDESGNVRPSYWMLRLILVPMGIGLISGLLANSGGFLLAPSYARILNQPLKKSFASSLAVSMVLALPGTIVHASLGHIDWLITGILALGSVPFSMLGAKVAIKANSKQLERVYGFALTGLGVYFLIKLLLR